MRGSSSSEIDRLVKAGIDKRQCSIAPDGQLLSSGLALDPITFVCNAIDCLQYDIGSFNTMLDRAAKLADAAVRVLFPYQLSTIDHWVTCELQLCRGSSLLLIHEQRASSVLEQPKGQIEFERLEKYFKDKLVNFRSQLSDCKKVNQSGGRCGITTAELIVSMVTADKRLKSSQAVMPKSVSVDCKQALQRPTPPVVAVASSQQIINPISLLADSIKRKIDRLIERGKTFDSATQLGERKFNAINRLESNFKALKQGEVTQFINNMKPIVNTLKQHQSIVKPILCLIASILIIPLTAGIGLFIGIGQLIYTRGNRFLFYTRDAKSGSIAESIQSTLNRSELLNSSALRQL